MTTIKSYTDLTQSKKLTEILSSESADFCWISIDDDGSFDGNWEALPRGCSLVAKDDNQIPCWSLSALLELMPMIGASNPSLRKEKHASKPIERYYIDMFPLHNTNSYAEPVDAAFEMVVWLKENRKI